MVFRESTERSLDERSFGREKRGIIVRYVCTVHKIILGSLIDPKARTAQDDGAVQLVNCSRPNPLSLYLL